MKMRENDYKVFLDIDEEQPEDYEHGVDELIYILFEEIKDFKQKEGI